MEAIIAGATGLTGRYLLERLLEEPAYTKVTALIRADMPLQHPRLHKVITDFDDLESVASEITGDTVFCALGTTRKKTPDRDLYRKIDYQYPLDIARIALRNGASQYHLVSALGANPDSGIFYSRLKGEVERDLKMLSYKNICIYRPSLLTGQRAEKRAGERFATWVMKGLNPLLIGSLKKYRSIPIETLAMAMLKRSLKDGAGIFTYDSDEIAKMEK